MNHLCLVTNDNVDYVKEWCEWHRPLFDVIHIYNNSTEPYKIQETYEYDASQVEAPQLKVYADCYSKLNFGDTLTVLDSDEFLETTISIDEWFKEHPTVDCLRYSWKVYGDCGQVKNDGRPVVERFDLPCEIDCVYNKDLPEGITENWHTKYTVRKTWKPTQLGIHNPIIQFAKQTNVLGDIVNGDSPWMKPVWDIACVRHYLTKSTEEFCERRLGKVDACGNVVCDVDKLKYRYFTLNKRTKEKEEVFNAYTGRVTKTV